MTATEQQSAGGPAAAEEETRLQRAIHTARGWIWQPEPADDEPDSPDGEDAEQPPLRVGPRLRAPICRVHDGSAELGRRWGRWIWPAAEDQQSIRGAAARLAGTGVVAYLAGSVLLDSPALMWPAAGTWCIVAHRTEPDDAFEEPATEPTSPTAAGDNGQEPAAAQSGPDPLVVLTDALIGDGRAVHLSAITDRLSQERPDLGWAAPQVRARLAALGVPVRASVKVAGSVRQGVHRDDLEPLLRPAPQPADQEAA